MVVIRYLLVPALTFTLLSLARTHDKHDDDTRPFPATTGNVSFKFVPPTSAKGKSKDKKAPKKNGTLEVGKTGISIDTKLDEKDGAYSDDKNHAKVFLVRLMKGKTYQFDMISNDFDSYLYLEDAGKKLLAQDDDTGGGDSGLDSQILFAPKEDGVYRVIATSFGGDELGNFKLMIVEK